ncbi:MAG TPA: hypothetical protein VM689_26475 [Aliidongia sp.]|nr:hypothetical protein [Aliidongia sp.]
MAFATSMGEAGDWKRRAVGLGVVAFCHLAVLAALPFLTATGPSAIRTVHTVMVKLTRPAPTPAPTIPPPPIAAPPQVIVPMPALPAFEPASVPPAERRPDSGPPVHFFTGTGSGPQSLPTTGVTAYAPRAPSNYGDQVGARIGGGAGGEASGPKTNQDCLINYQVTIDRHGNLLSYKIDPCTSALVNAVAEARIKAAAPYPPPPDTGAAQYTIYRSQIFHYDPALGKPAK